MKKYLNKKNIILSSLILLLILIIIFLFFNPFVYFRVNKNKNIIVEVGEELSLPTVKAYMFTKDITKYIKKKVM